MGLASPDEGGVRQRTYEYVSDMQKYILKKIMNHPPKVASFGFTQHLGVRLGGQVIFVFTTHGEHYSTSANSCIMCLLTLGRGRGIMPESGL